MLKVPLNNITPTAILKIYKNLDFQNVFVDIPTTARCINYYGICRGYFCLLFIFCMHVMFRPIFLFSFWFNVVLIPGLYIIKLSSTSFYSKNHSIKKPLYIWYKDLIGHFFSTNTNIVPFWSTWIHPRFLVGLVLLDL